MEKFTAIWVKCLIGASPILECACLWGTRSEVEIVTNAEVTAGGEMEDVQIIEMFWEKKEEAIDAVSQKYGSYCRRIAWNILNNEEDCEECLNDTWMAAWSRIPPQRPRMLGAFLGKITRSLAIDVLRKKCASKRPDTHLTGLEEELCGLSDTLSEIYERKVREEELTALVNQFLGLLSEADRDMFVRRYWYLDSIREVAARHGVSQSRVKSSLYRSRKKLGRMLLAQFPEYREQYLDRKGEAGGLGAMEKQIL